MKVLAIYFAVVIRWSGIELLSGKG